MKKEYIKPQIYSEEFEVAENIADSCEEPNYSHYSGGCKYDDGVFVYFYATTGCIDDGDTSVIITPDNESKYCTYGPSGTVFNS